MPQKIKCMHLPAGIRKRTFIVFIVLTISLFLWVRSAMNGGEFSYSLDSLKQMVLPAQKSEIEQFHEETDQEIIEFNRILKSAKKILEKASPVLITIVNDAYLPFTYSWLCNTASMHIHQHVLFITSDKESKKALRKNWPNVITVSLDDSEDFIGDQVYSHAGYVKLMVKRTDILLSLLQSDIPILLFEVDCLWLKNPLPLLQSFIEFDVIGTTISDRPTQVAGGFLILRPRPAMIDLWKKLTDMMRALQDKIRALPPGNPISEGDNDQVYFSDLIHKGYGGIKSKILPFSMFADGKWYLLKHEEREKYHPYIINNNWILGNKKKIDRAKSYSHWFLNDDNACDLRQVKKTVSAFNVTKRV